MIIYKDNSFNLISSTTAPLLDLTPSFCIVLEIWFLTVFSLISKSVAISLVVLLSIKRLNISFSLFVNKLLISIPPHKKISYYFMRLSFIVEGYCYLKLTVTFTLF